MKRTNTADSYTIAQVKELRKQGITDFYCTTNTGKKTLKTVVKGTAQGISAYANKMYRKYGDEVTVNVGYFDSNCNWVDMMNYHA